MVYERIEALITHFCKGNKSLFAKQIGVTPSVIGNITGERKGNPSFEVAQKILDAFASVSSDWLMLGHGPMLRTEQSDTELQLTIQSNLSLEESILYKMYKEKEDKVEMLLKEIGRLEERLRALEPTISVDATNQSPDNIGNPQKVTALPAINLSKKEKISEL